MTRAKRKLASIPSPLRVIKAVYQAFDIAVLLLLLGMARILNLLGVIRFGWFVVHWWRGDMKR